MRRRVIGFVSIGVMTVVSIAAWTVQEPVDAVVNAKIRDEGLNRSQVAPIFNMLVDTIGPRLTSPAHKRAAESARDGDEIRPLKRGSAVRFAEAGSRQAHD